MESTTSSDFYFFAQSDGDTKETANTSEDFVINLNRQIVLNGEWEVAVINYKSPAYNKSYYLCSDVVESSLLNTVQLPYIKIIYENASATLPANKFKPNGKADGVLHVLYPQPVTEGVEYRQLEYHSVGKKIIARVRIFLVDERFNANRTAGGQTSLLLHFRPKP